MTNKDMYYILNLLPHEARLAEIAMAVDDICPELIDHPTYKEWRRKSIAFEMQQNALIDELERRQEYIPEEGEAWH